VVYHNNRVWVSLQDSNLNHEPTPGNSAYWQPWSDQGATGSTGPTGAQGATGAEGAQGLQGATGALGPAGGIGATGAQGNIGATGAQGIQGNTGATGAQGVQGDIGATGAQGPAGSGATGATGVTGATGPGALASLNYAQTTGGAGVTITTGASFPANIVSVTITTTGGPVQISSYGDAENVTAATWAQIQIYRGSTALGTPVNLEGSAGSENTAFGLNYVDNPSAGTYTYYLKANSVNGGNFKFGEGGAPTITAVELAGVVGSTGPAGANGSSANLGSLTITNAVISTIGAAEDLVLNPAVGSYVKVYNTLTVYNQSTLPFRHVGATGTIAAPIPPASGNIIGGLSFAPWDGNAFAGYPESGLSGSLTATSFIAYAGETWNTSSHGVSFIMRGYPNGTNSWYDTNKRTVMQVWTTNSTYTTIGAGSWYDMSANTNATLSATGWNRKAMYYSIGNGSQSDNSQPSLAIQANTSTGALLALKAFRWSGTLTTSTLSADTLGSVGFFGNFGQTAQSTITFGATTQGQGAFVQGYAEENWTSAARGTSITLGATLAGTNTAVSSLIVKGGGIALQKGLTETVYDMGNALATPTINVNSATVFKMVLTGTTTINSLSNVAAGQNATLILKQDGTGSRTLSSTMLFAGASKTLSTAASATDIISVFYDGTNYYASLVKGFA
jgi:hypothetical protein